MTLASLCGDLAQARPIKNDARFPGSLAGDKELFGPCGRYATGPVHTRGENVSWLVWDAEVVDEVTGLAAVIRQEPSRDRAVEGLPLA